MKQFLRTNEKTQLNSERRLLIGGNHLPKKLKKVSISKTDKKKLIVNQNNDHCGCLRACACGRKYKIFKNDQEKSYFESQVIVRDLNSVIGEQEEFEELFADVYVRKDGAFRLNIALNQISFGWQQVQTERIENNKIKGIINVVKRIKEKQKKSFEKSNEILSCFHNNFDKEIATNLTNFFTELSESRFQICTGTIAITKEDQLLKEMQFQRFQFNCFEYLQNISKLKMFAYNIGRVNPKTEDTQIFHSGYSEAFLNLIGLDFNSLSSLLLRRKTIDLVSDVSDITRISAHILNWITHNHNIIPQNDNEMLIEINLKCEPISLKIVTFDGFPLTLHQQCRIIPISANESGQMTKEDWSSAQFLQIFELDINSNELEGLINYRKRLSTMQGKLSVEDFLKQELSLMFEDVEYSVISQNFVEKYYSDIMPFLYSLQRSKQENQSQFNDEKQRCNFKVIKQ